MINKNALQYFYEIIYGLQIIHGNALICKWRTTSKKFQKCVIFIWNLRWIRTGEKFKESFCNVDFFYDTGIEEKVVVNNHFPCDCRIRGFVGGSLFINQSLGDAMDSNFCISPFEVHGLSLLSASRNLSLLHNCSELTSFGVSAAETTTEIPALASLPASQNRNRPLALVIYATALFTLLKIRWTLT